MPPPGIKKPSLPLHLLKELGASGRIPVRRQHQASHLNIGRLETRQEARGRRSAVEQSGGRKNGASSSAPQSILKRKRPDPEENEEESDDFDEGDEDDDEGDPLSDVVLDENSDDDLEDKDEEEGFSDVVEEKVPPKQNVSRSVKDKLAQDDAEIADLERKLGLKNRKNLPQSFKDDGLGDLLDGLSGGFDEEKQGKRKRKAEADEWLAQKRRKAEAAAAAQARPEPETDMNSKDEVGSDLEEDADELDDENLGGSGSEEDGFSGEEMDSDDQADNQDDFEGFGSEDEEAAEQEPPKRARENPYVAPSTGQTAKYVPPSLRKELGSDAELAARIRRQTQGLVNRITESNLLSIITDIEKLYREYPRQHVTSSLVDLLLVQVCDPTSLPDTLLILTAGFATAAYMVLGTDFGGQLIQEVVERFEKYYKDAKVAALERPDVPKQTSNLITFISELYTFQLIGPNLIFDYIRMLLDNLSELNAELLLRIVRMCGPTLRQDDPMALKDIVSLIPPAVAKAGEKNLTVRTKFMIDTITDLKNNKLKAGAGASAVVSEHITRMKKLLGQLKSRKLKSTEPMRMGLKDIQDADKKGKWWLVGASWAGRSASEKETAKATTAEEDDSDDESIILDDVDQGPDLAELAREQGMNTEVRRSIFISIMSAMDYQDAYLRILKLRLNKERQREVPNVMIRCVGAEQHYNPYYTLIAKRLCSEQREVRWAFQSSLWKLFGRMGETGFGEDEVEEDEEEDGTVDMRRLVNTAKMFGALVAGNTLGVIVLKRLNLLYLQKKTRDFVEIMLVNVLLECQGNERPEEAVTKVFGGVEAAPDLARGLQYFLKKVERDLVIIGGGVAGYVAAIKAGQEGMKVTCIEKRGTLGGTCLNVGCIPSKSLLNNSHLYHQILHDTKHRGIEVGDVKLNLKQLMKAKEQSVSGLTKGVEFLFKKNGVEYIKGSGSFQDEHTIKVQLNDGGETSVTGKNILIATGSEVTPFPGLEIDEQTVISSTGAIALEKVPKKLMVIGGGIIGLEMASVWSRLGSEVTVVEFLDQIGGPGMDTEIAKSIQKILKKQGINFKTGTKVVGGDKADGTVKINVDSAKGGKAETLDADVVLVAIGRRPYTGGLGLENIGLELDERGRVIIDSEYRTKIPHIRCVGDVTFGPMLAHKAEEEAVAVVEYIKKGYGHVNYGVIPAVMYTFPEVAWVGQSEQDLKKAGIPYRVGTFPFSANSRAKTNLDSDGMVKMLADPETDRLLGVHIIGPNAGEMIAEGTLALEYGASCEDIARTCHAHPTLAEAFKEAAMATYSKAIHF
ncbi:hypothetical protein C8A05DRAFT_40925 [Staphylotrichum tortipilum]|uniref:Dihydrolipoyl dehydrogenase n=1 Tax=Staphylotrichum tortipilum TaxID=2831512 RepID=A0AAN6RXB8_9PEZI|nr:hypothetical protein C8A05DRAFT_40925 [Staphylotrichum longicolle]